MGSGEAEHSAIGIVLAALSLAVMPFLSAAQRRAGRELGSASAVADSKQSLLCTYLSAVLLANSLFGWSWADPIAALVIAAVAVKEGRDAWHGKGCCAPRPQRPRTRRPQWTPAAPVAATEQSPAARPDHPIHLVAWFAAIVNMPPAVLSLPCPACARMCRLAGSPAPSRHRAVGVILVNSLPPRSTPVIASVRSREK
ncbi:cation transporter [Streptomyces wedmorensis]|uniref:cation transporter n=1 Tax=Streptomyces wedmorensis TaxID=43759 RepID=UPI003787C9CD